MLHDPHPPLRRRRRAPMPASPIVALAVAVIAGDPTASVTHQVILIGTVVIAVLATVCDVLAWQLKPADR